MLQNIKELIGASIHATDGDLGKLKDLLFDDLDWTLRYVVADTGGWLRGRKVLISPFSLGETHLGRLKTRIEVNLTRQQIEEAPSLDEHAPVSRLYEQELARFYAQPNYWEGNMLWGIQPFPAGTEVITKEWVEQHTRQVHQIEHCHLRSAREVTGYHLDAKDGEIGHVEDLLADNVSWRIRYLIVDTKNWWPGRHVLIAPKWASEIRWESRTLSVQLTRDQVKRSPEYRSGEPISPDYEKRLLDHYGFPAIEQSKSA